MNHTTTEIENRRLEAMRTAAVYLDNLGQLEAAEVAAYLRNEMNLAPTPATEAGAELTMSSKEANTIVASYRCENFHRDTPAAEHSPLPETIVLRPRFVEYRAYELLRREHDELTAALRAAALKLHALAGPSSGDIGHELRGIRDELAAVLERVEGKK